MSRRNTVRVLSFSLSIALVCLIFGFKTQKENERYALYIENSYSYMLDELNTASNNIATILNKARFVTTKPQINAMAAKLLTEAEISKNSLAQLPVAGQLSSLNRFFSQVGNYALAVSKSENDVITEEQSRNIETLSAISVKVSDILNRSRENFNNLEYWASELKNQVEDVIDTNNLSSTLTELEDEFNDYPTLIYDGPYSDHILEKEPILINEMSEVSETEAFDTALKWTKTENLDFAGITDGKIATFDFLGNDISVSVTKKGGLVLNFRKFRPIEDIVLNYEQAVLKADAYLEAMGMRNLTETYFFESDGVCTINYAFLDGKTVCYTDLIKIGVAMDNGEIVFYEAAGYISNHKDRAFQTPEITEEEAGTLISSKLAVNNVQLALIPTDSVEEKRCYEFSCVSNDNQEVLVYINTAALVEEEILILQKSDGGILVN